jgi:hypothetical protein
MNDSMRLLRTSLVFGGAVFWLLTLAAIALLLLSRSNPWLIGKQRQPYWAWAVGSGRIKLWVAEQPEFFAPENWWPNMYYRGLDGQAIRWDVTLERQVAVMVVALPLWLVGLACAAVGTSMIAFGTVGSHRSSRSECRQTRGPPPR